MMNVLEKMFSFLFPQFEGEEEQRRAEEGEARYLQRKAKRVAERERQSAAAAAQQS